MRLSADWLRRTDMKKRSRRKRHQQRVLMLFVGSMALILILIAVSTALPKREKTSVPQTAMIDSAQNSNAEPEAKAPEPTVNAVFDANSESTQTAESAAVEANVEPAQTAELAALESDIEPTQPAESAALEANVEPAQTAELAALESDIEPTQPAEFAAAGSMSEPTYSPPPADTEILITAVGDCTLGGDNEYGLEDRFRKYYDQYGADYFFSGVRNLFESDDLTIVNLEGPLTTSRDKREGRKFNFRGSPEYVNILSGSSVEIANLANNHAYDYGESGFQETAEVLENAGICASGFTRAGFLDVKGVRVASVGFYDKEHSKNEMVGAVEYLRDQCDLLIVSIHWGKEYTHEPTSDQRAIGHALIDAGADLVIGNHSHVYGGLEMYKDKYIIYSLGNFCFGGNSNPDDKNCTIFQQRFVIAPDGTTSDGGISIIPATISSTSRTNDYSPRIQNPETGVNLLSKIIGVSRARARKGDLDARKLRGRRRSCGRKLKNLPANNDRAEKNVL